MGKIDINSASLDELRSIDGIGDRRAQIIVSHREATGGFNSLEELADLPYFDNLSPNDFEVLKEHIEVRSATIPFSRRSKRSA